MVIRLLILHSCIFFFAIQLNAQQAWENAFPELTFTQPVDIQNANDGSERLFVAEMAGRIQLFQNAPTTTEQKSFLDITDRVFLTNRYGFMGFCFHPDYENNGFFYVNYNRINPERTIISRFKVSANDPDQADASSEMILLEINQPDPLHNGGQMVFGANGYLYIALGDGGPGSDPSGHGQDRTSLLGTILRIDVDNPDAGKNYGIPDDNPFVGNTNNWREEIWAWGLRNPWRMTIDPVTKWMWVGENGENRMEEINRIEKGKNYGWNTMEGSLCFNPLINCDTSGLQLPLYEYGNNTTERRSCIGGHVYRGTAIPELYGKYIFGDFVQGTIWALDFSDIVNPVRSTLADNQQNMVSFGLDEQGELYWCNIVSGQIRRFTRPATSTTEVRSPLQLQILPNPAHTQTMLHLSIAKPVNLQIDLFDQLGRHLATVFKQSSSFGTIEVPINIEELGSGLYFLQVQSEGRSIIRKLAVLH